MGHMGRTPCLDRSSPFIGISDVSAIAFWGVDQLSSISAARTRGRRSIRHSRSAILALSWQVACHI
jgi:hypothetical protein